MKNLFSRPQRGYLSRRTRKNACFMLFWAVLFFVVYIFYVDSAAMYVKNAATDGVALKADELLATVGQVKIAEQSTHFDYDAIGESVPQSLYVEQIYIQSDGYYRFLVEIEAVEVFDIGYYPSDSEVLRFFRGDEAAFERQGDIVQQLAVVTVAGQDFPALLPYGWTPEAGKLADCAVFVRLPGYVGWDLGLTDYADKEVADHLLDFRNIPVESEGNDLIMIVVFSILFPLFLLYAIAALIFPRLHINYLLASRYGEPDELSAQIDYELTLEGVYKQSRQVYTENFILRETLHTTRIMKNHLKRH